MRRKKPREYPGKDRLGAINKAIKRALNAPESSAERQRRVGDEERGEHVRLMDGPIVCDISGV